MTTTHNTTFNIVQFIEKNPLTKLNETYQNTIINKIKDEFNEEEQKIFVTSFYSYLNFNPITDFIIDFDDVWKWCGFSRKDSAKRILDKFFKKDTDYIISPSIGGEIKERGCAHKKEKITLNIKTFKKFCLKSDTKKADEIHNYYIKLEEILHATLLEQTDELKLQLEEKNNKLEESQEQIKKLKRKYIKSPKIVSEDKNVVYLMASTESEKVGEYVIGKATDLSERKADYNHNKIHDFNVIYYKSCNSSKLMDIVESSVLMKLGKYRCKAGRDVFLLPEKENILLFTKIFDECVKFYEDVDDDCVVYAKRTIIKMDKEQTRIKNEKYRSEHIEELKEQQKEFYQDNKAMLAEIKKVYYDKNVDKLNEQHREYYKENKEEIIKNVMEYYGENKEHILEQRKEFYNDNKEKILKERSDYYKENYKTKIAAQRQKKETCECGMVITHYYLKKHKKSSRHKLLMEKNGEI
jgi:hypothetical protein